MLPRRAHRIVRVFNDGLRRDLAQDSETVARNYAFQIARSHRRPPQSKRQTRRIKQSRRRAP